MEQDLFVVSVSVLFVSKPKLIGEKPCFINIMVLRVTVIFILVLNIMNTLRFTSFLCLGWSSVLPRCMSFFPKLSMLGIHL